MKSNGNYLNRNRLTNAISLLLKQEFDGNSKFKALILEQELIEDEVVKTEPEGHIDEEGMIIDTSAAGIEKAKEVEQEKARKDKMQA